MAWSRIANPMVCGSIPPTVFGVEMIYYWYACPNCQLDVTLTDGDVCQFCGKLITLEQYEQDDESYYQNDIK